jgi:hypothetical protein
VCIRPFKEIFMAESKIAERRLKKRHPFSATSEVTELTTGARLSTRAADLSLQGCYLDSLNPFAVGTRIRVCISWDGTELTCAAIVRDSQPGLGMGVSFANLDEAHVAILQGWINKLDPGEAAAAGTMRAPEERKPAPTAEMKEKLALKLIDLLQKKGMLNASEVSDLLRDKS